MVHIAEALQVSPAELYNPPTDVAPTRKAAGDGVLEQESEALLHAYRRIQDPKERQRLLTLVQKAVEEV